MKDKKGGEWISEKDEGSRDTGKVEKKKRKDRGINKEEKRREGYLGKKL